MNSNGQVYSWFRPTCAASSATSALVEEIFGLDHAGYRAVPVLDQVPVPRTGITYVTGFSGAGKSKLLELFAARNPDAHVPGEPAGDEPLVDLFDFDLSETLSLLGQVGLGEAFSYLTPYRGLSDGQKTRARLALCYAQRHRLLVIDEFLSNVDRTSARIVAFCFQRFCRKHGMAALVATAHDDLLEPLAPDLLIRLDHHGQHTLTPTPVPAPVRPFSDQITIRAGSLADYAKLSRFHYMGDVDVSDQVFDLDVLVAEVEGHVAGVHVLSPPYPTRWQRFAQFADVNQALMISRRTVVHPVFRGIGLARILSDPNLARRQPVFGRSALQRFQPFMLVAGYRPVEVATERRTQLGDEVAELLIRLDAGGNAEVDIDRVRPLLARRNVELLTGEYAQYREIGELPALGEADQAKLEAWFARCTDVLSAEQLLAAVRPLPMAGFVAGPAGAGAGKVLTP